MRNTHPSTAGSWFFLIWLLLVALGTASAAGVYRWVDGQGRVHYGDRPPGDAAAESLALPDAPSGETQSSITERYQRYRAETPARPQASPRQQVAVFTTQDCGYCKQAKAHLNRAGVPFREYDIQQDARARSRYDQLGGGGVPLILVGERRLSGYSAARLDAMLAEAGLLQ